MRCRLKLSRCQSRSQSRRRSAPALYQQAKALRGLPDPDRAGTPYPPRTKRCHRCQKVYAHSRNVTQGAIRYVKLKSEGRWPTCSAEGCDREAKTARGKHCAAHAERLRKGQDMTVPVRTPCRVRGGCSIEGRERPRHARGWCSHHWRRWHRHGDPLASRCPRYTVDELWRLNAYLVPRWRADQARGC